MRKILSLRHISANQETYINSLEFIESYSGPSFRSSSEKFRVAFASVPTNLHLQQFVVEKITHDYLTCGAVCAIPLRFMVNFFFRYKFGHFTFCCINFYFQHGGLSRLRVDLHSSINDPVCIDHMLDSRFFHRRNSLQAAKSVIGELSQQAEMDWNFTELKSTEKVGLRLLAEIKQVFP